MAGKDVYDDDREAIGWVKRVLEYITMIPGFEEELKKDPKGTLDKYGFPLTPEDVALSHTDPDDPMRLRSITDTLPKIIVNYLILLENQNFVNYFFI